MVQREEEEGLVEIGEVVLDGVVGQPEGAAHLPQRDSACDIRHEEQREVLDLPAVQVVPVDDVLVEDVVEILGEEARPEGAFGEEELREAAVPEVFGEK